MAQEAEKTEYTFTTDTGAKITVPVDKYPTKEEAKQAAKQFKEDLIQRVYPDGLPPGSNFSVDTDVVGEKKQGFGANFLEGVRKNADDLYQNWMDTFTYSSTFKDDDAVVQRRQEIEQEIQDDLIRYGEVDSFQKFLDDLTSFCKEQTPSDLDDLNEKYNAQLLEIIQKIGARI